jgi:hypothetical protein
MPSDSIPKSRPSPPMSYSRTRGVRTHYAPGTQQIVTKRMVAIVPQKHYVTERSNK